jgi:hypothetical protein
MSGTQPSSALELITTIAITAGSVALFLYWFRYTCMLILTAQSAHDYAGSLAETKGLEFPNVQAQLRTNANRDLDNLYRALDRDYAVIRPLLETSGTDAVQARMLGLYYQTLRACYTATRAFSPSATRRALDEMATVIAHFANVAGEAAA